MRLDASGSIDPWRPAGSRPGEGRLTIARVHGSHHIMRHPDGRGTTIPVHRGRDVAKGTLRNILSDIGMTIDDLRKNL
jgi:hypothetical protein